uniref:E4 protein n=1 Tax=Human papillomavirus TaxID=10566 RepID=A0A385PI40_9PAPI|nr:MAG: E4 protein [Human papillomavirus]
MKIGPGPRPPSTARKVLEGDPKKPNRAPTPTRPPHPHLEYDVDDDDENQENQEPPTRPLSDEEQRGNWGPTLHQLLEKWDQDLKRLQDTVIRDLNGYRQRLGIH